MLAHLVSIRFVYLVSFYLVLGKPASSRFQASKVFASLFLQANAVSFVDEHRDLPKARGHAWSMVAHGGTLCVMLKALFGGTFINCAVGNL